MADIDPTLMENILNVTKGKRKPDIHHYSNPDDLR